MLNCFYDFTDTWSNEQNKIETNRYRKQTSQLLGRELGEKAEGLNSRHRQQYGNYKRGRRVEGGRREYRKCK